MLLSSVSDELEDSGYLAIAHSSYSLDITHAPTLFLRGPSFLA